jgi:hypothetical protein
MNLITINFVAIRKSVSKFLKNDKRDGVKKAFYFTHLYLNQNQAMDTKKQFDEQVALYESQGIKLVKTVDKSAEVKALGGEACKLHIFRKEGAVLQRATNYNGEYIVDNISCSLGYMPAECETTIAEIFFTKK